MASKPHNRDRAGQQTGERQGSIGRLSNIDTVVDRQRQLEAKYGIALNLSFGGPHIPGYEGQDMWTVRISRADTQFTIVDLQLPSATEVISVGLNAAAEWLAQHQTRRGKEAA
jgi:hypothetical protein